MIGTENIRLILLGEDFDFFWPFVILDGDKPIKSEFNLNFIDYTVNLLGKPSNQENSI